MEETTVRHKRKFTGNVMSIAGTQSVVVEVSRRVLHATYRKYVTKRARSLAHDQNNICAKGDSIQIEECRPMSARKRWRVVKVIVKAPVA